MLAIERASFADPWRLHDFAEARAGDLLFLVAADDGGVEGYLIARRVAEEGEILNLAVAPACRRAGLGRMLTAHGLRELRAQGVESVFLEVRESNAAARRLYETLGFRPVGRRPRYYRSPAEDAVILRAAISAEAPDAIL